MDDFHLLHQSVPVLLLGEVDDKVLAAFSGENADNSNAVMIDVAPTIERAVHGCSHPDLVASLQF